MKQLRALIKVQLLSTFPLTAARNKADAASAKKAKRQLTTMGVLAFCSVYMAVIYSTGFLETLGENSYYVVPALMMTGASVLSLLSALLRSKAVLFNASGFDSVLSLPIPMGTVAASRLFALYFYEFIITAGMLLGTGVCCSLYVAALPWHFYPVLLAFTVLTPLLPMTVGTLLGVLISALTARMKAKNAFATVFQLLFVLGIMLLSFSSGNLFTNFSDVAAMLEQRLYSLYPLSKLFIEALAEGNVLSLLLFAFVSLGAFAALWALITRFFLPLYGFTNASAKSRRFVMTRQKSAAPLKALYKKELTAKLSCSVWLLNTDFGTLMALIGSVALAIVGREKMDSVLKAIPLLAQYPGAALAIAVGAVQCLSLPASAAVSMEGKTLWLMKELPIKADDWFKSKLLMSMTAPVLGGVLCGGILTFGLSLSWWEGLLIPLVSLLFSWTISVLGLALNLRFPRFDWDNPAEPCKQGMPVLLGMLGDFLAALLAVGAVLLLGFSAGMGVFCLLLLLLALLLRLRLRKAAEKIRLGL